MAEPPDEQGCPKCAGVLLRLEQMERRVAELESELAAARKNSGNSSKPPSSDIVKPKPSDAQGRPAGKRKRGAQPGHPRHERAAFDESQIDAAWDYHCPVCPDCGGAVEPAAEPPRVIQQVELVAMPIEISEHRSQACWCPQCERTHF